MTSAEHPTRAGTVSTDLPDTQQMSGSSGSSGTSGSSGDAQATTQAVREESKHLAGTATDQARHVADEAAQQARNVVDEATAQLDDQSRQQRDRLVHTLHGFADDLDTMGAQAPSGLASELTGQVARRAHDLCNRLDGREPREILDDLRGYARRNPGKFLLGALVAGMVAGRLARGAKDDASDQGSSRGPSSAGTGSTGAAPASVAATPRGGQPSRASGDPLAGVTDPALPSEVDDLGLVRGDEPL